MTCFKFLQIPKGAQPGELLILRGKGTFNYQISLYGLTFFFFACTIFKMRVPAGLPKQGFFVDHGDQYVRLRVSVPT